MQVLVRDNNVEQALRVLKKKLQREGLLPAPKRKLPVGKGRPGAGPGAGAPRPAAV